MPDINDSDNFYDWLVIDKNSNLERIRNTVDTGQFQSGSIPKPQNPVVPNLENNPSLVNDFAERKASQAEGRAIQEQNAKSSANWSTWQNKRATSQAMPIVIGSLAYYFLFK